MDDLLLGLLLSTQIEAMAVTAEMEAMKAANQERSYQRKAPAFNEAAFREISYRLISLSQQVVK